MFTEKVKTQKRTDWECMPVCPPDAVARIEKLEDLNLINFHEARILKERMKSESGNIEKCNSLVRDLKKKYL